MNKDLLEIEDLLSSIRTRQMDLEALEKFLYDMAEEANKREAMNVNPAFSYAVEYFAKRLTGCHTLLYYVIKDMDECVNEAREIINKLTKDEREENKNSVETTAK